jgi:hypothetical protein
VSGSSSATSRKTNKARAASDLDLTNILTGAVRSVDKLSESVVSKQSRDHDDNDEDWLFARAVYLKLKAMPPSRDKEMFKLRVQSDLFSLSFGSTVMQNQTASYPACSSGSGVTEAYQTIAPTVNNCYRPVPLPLQSHMQTALPSYMRPTAVPVSGFNVTSLLNGQQSEVNDASSTYTVL